MTLSNVLARQLSDEVKSYQGKYVATCAVHTLPHGEWIVSGGKITSLCRLDDELCMTVDDDLGELEVILPRVVADKYDSLLELEALVLIKGAVIRLPRTKDHPGRCYVMGSSVRAAP
jgi:hypothetical protein